jgi:hypothetical protein
MESIPPPPYKVELLQSARAEIVRCSKEAQRRGIIHEYLGTLRWIYDKLTNAPHSCGEEFCRFPAAKLVLRKTLHDRILVVYAVHQEQPIVFVKECRPVLDHPLESV